MNSNEIKPVKIKLGLRATSLLAEEFPLASIYLNKLSDNEWIFESEVCSYDVVGRFVMGLLDDVEIIETQELQKHITDHSKIIQDKFIDLYDDSNPDDRD